MVLVTGGAGYVGSIVVEQLLGRGFRVLVVDDLRQGYREAVPPEAVFVQADIGDRSSMIELMRGHDVGAVVHMAAETVIERSVVDPRLFFHENAVKTLELLDAMAEAGVNKFVFSSTAAVYGIPQSVPVTEEHPQNPISAYGETKRIVERALAYYHDAYGLRSVSLRYFNAGGASGARGEAHRPERHLIPLVLRAAYGKQEVQVFGSSYETPDGTCIRDYVHVLDLAEAHAAALERMNGCHAFNLGTERGASVLEIIRTAEKVTGREVRWNAAPSRAGDPPVLIASNRKAGEELGWRPQRSLECILESAWQWMLAHPDGYGSES